VRAAQARRRRGAGRAARGETAFCVCVLKRSGVMPGYHAYLVNVSVEHTPLSRSCPGCSKCVYCKKNESPVYPYHEKTEPNTFHVDSKEPVTVNREETRTTDTNEKEFKKGDKCFYKSRPFQEGIIENVDNSVNPTSYGVQIIPRSIETTAEKLFREIPDDGEVSDGGVLQEDPVHEIQSDHIVAVAENNGPWTQSNEQLKNQLSKLNNFPGMMTNRVHKHTLHEPQRREYFPSMMTHRVHNYKPSGQQPNIATESTTVRGKLPSESGVRSRRAGPDTSTAKPRWLDDEWNPVMYPEAEFGCMSLKSLHQLSTLK